jgi:hypothetical protein
MATPSVGARYWTVEACFPRLSTYSGMRFISRLGEGGRWVPTSWFKVTTDFGETAPLHHAGPLGN